MLKNWIAARRRGYDEPEYEPLSAAAQDLEMTLSLHIGSNRPGPGQQMAVGEGKINKPSILANIDHWVRVSLSDMIFSGVVERFPKLQVGSVERELTWVPHFLDRIDYQYTQRPASNYGYRFNADMFPRSRQLLEKILLDCTEDEKAKIVGGNAAREYGLD